MDSSETEAPEGTTFCANQGGTCTLREGGGRVYYGRQINCFQDGPCYKYFYKDYSSATNVPCNDDEFCDPVWGTKKCFRDSAWCGGHAASNCANCPVNGDRWMGSVWCNGDCTWINNECVDAATTVTGSESAWCGGHAASNCANCPVNGDRWMGSVWCNGHCTWSNNECVDAAKTVTGPMPEDNIPETQPLLDSPVVEVKFASPEQALLIFALLLFSLIASACTVYRFCWAKRAKATYSEVVAYSDDEQR